MTREEAFKEINETQDYYVNELAKMIDDPNRSSFRYINFTSPTGTGKTKMMAKLMNLMPNRYFIITTLSRGQLHLQVKSYLKQDCLYNNYDVYGTSDYRINSKLQADDIISKIPNNTECIWLRDEGHIKTNRFDALLIKKCFKVINFSATNQTTDIKCNFTHTMMLRTVHQEPGTPEDAIKKLIEVKEYHKEVKDYNPCALFRCIDDEITKTVIDTCNKYGLKFINITVDDYDMSDLCKDDNEYDVIINKFKITEGIDIRRAHVLYVDNQPSNIATTIQVIGRCRRNALLYRNDVNIFSIKKQKLLENTRQCFVYYNVSNMKVDTDSNGELEFAFCDNISVEQLKPNSHISVKKGKLNNGLTVIELREQTGGFDVVVDEKLGFNVVKPETNFYEFKNEENENKYLYLHSKSHWANDLYYEYSIDEIKERLTIERPVKQYFDHYDEDKKAVYKEIHYPAQYDLHERKREKTSIIMDKKTLLEEMTRLFIQKFEQCNNGPVIQQDKNGIWYVYTKTNANYKYLMESTPDYFQSYLTHRCDYVLGEDYIMTKNDVAKFVDSLFVTTRKSENKGTKKYNIKYQINKISSLFNLLQDVYVVEGKGERVLNPKPIRANDQNFKNTHLVCESNCIDLSYLEHLKNGYIKTVNDRESAIIGVDCMKMIKLDSGEVVWSEDSAVTSKTSKYCKFNSYIEKTYKTQLLIARNNTFSGKNDFKISKKCNSCLGYCVEYYSKYLLYGKGYLEPYITQVAPRTGVFGDMPLRDHEVIRACMLKYRSLMCAAYGSGIARIIKTIGVEQLIEASNAEFIKIVVELGTKTAEFVKEKLYKNNEPTNNIDPNLSIRHIAGLADYITEDTILDVKVTNHIDESMVKQVLGYHYLSTKRSDLHIKRLIVYDAVSGRCVEINL